MPYLLDTNHCIYLMNGWNKEEEKRKLTDSEINTLNSFLKIKNDVVLMSEVSIGEIVYGIEHSRRKEYNRLAFDTLSSAVPPVSVTKRAWEIYGQTKAGLRKNGIVMPDLDLLIASTAKRYNLVLVANDSHMRHLPATFVIENWAKGC